MSSGGGETRAVANAGRLDPGRRARGAMRALQGLAALLLAGAACRPSRAALFTDPRAGDALRAELAADPRGEVAAVHRLWLTYLQSKNGWFDCRPSEYWLASEQGTWTTPDGREAPRCYDLAGSMIRGRHTHEVLRIERVRGSARREYRITARFRLDSTNARDAAPRAAIVTVFAVRDGDDWKLGGALPRLTRTWRRETIGPFTYIIRPGHRFSHDRARRGVAFADSLADAFRVPRLQSLRYYIVADGDEMLRIMGYEPDTTYGTPGGRSLPGLIIAGDTAFGESHGHEIAHHVLQPLYGPRLHIVASEGVPTWVGGTRGMTYEQALDALRAYLLADPSATLDSVIADNAHPMHNPASALLAAMVHEHGGVEAIRQFLDSGPSLARLRAGVASILDAPWPEIARRWRRRAIAP